MPKVSLVPMDDTHQSAPIEKDAEILIKSVISHPETQKDLLCISELIDQIRVAYPALARVGGVGPAAWSSAERPAAWSSAERPAAWSSAERPAAWSSAERPAAWSSAERPVAS